MGGFVRGRGGELGVKPLGHATLVCVRAQLRCGGAEAWFPATVLLAVGFAVAVVVAVPVPAPVVALLGLGGGRAEAAGVAGEFERAAFKPVEFWWWGRGAFLMVAAAVLADAFGARGEGWRGGEVAGKVRGGVEVHVRLEL